MSSHLMILIVDILLNQLNRDNCLLSYPISL